jgi:hypothetical protein
MARRVASGDRRARQRGFPHHAVEKAPEAGSDPVIDQPG